MYDRRLETEREVAKAVVEFFTDVLDPNLPMDLDYDDKDDDDDESQEETSDSGELSPASSEAVKPGCVIYDFYRVFILVQND